MFENHHACHQPLCVLLFNPLNWGTALQNIIKCCNFTCSSVQMDPCITKPLNLCSPEGSFIFILPSSPYLPQFPTSQNCSLENFPQQRIVDPGGGDGGVVSLLV